MTSTTFSKTESTSSSLNRSNARSSFGGTLARAAYGVAAFLLAVNLRESLDATTSGDKSDGATTWGM